MCPCPRPTHARGIEIHVIPVFPQDFEGVKSTDIVFETLITLNQAILACPWWDIVDYFQQASWDALGIPH